MKKFFNLLVISFSVIALEFLMLILTKTAILIYIPFLVLSFFSPFSYYYFFVEYKVIEKSKTDYTIFIFPLLAFLISPVGFVLFILCENSINKKN